MGASAGRSVPSCLVLRDPAAATPVVQSVTARALQTRSLAPGLAGSQIDVVLAQKAPNILNVNILQRHRQLDRLILSRSKNAEAGRYCNLIVAMMVDRLIAPRSKLGFVRAVDDETATTSQGDVLGLGHVREREAEMPLGQAVLDTPCRARSQSSAS
jgi:hypothetical protein